MNTLTRFAAETYPELRLGIADRTVEEYCISAHAFERWRGSPIPVDDLNEPQLRGFLLHRLRVEQKSPYTVNKDRRQLLALWECAFEFEYHERPPYRKLVKRVREPRRVPTAWSTEELRRLFAAAARSEPIRDWSPRRWRPLFLTAYDTAYRIGCLLQVRWEQLSADGFLTVYAEQQKGQEDTVRKLCPHTVTDLEQFRGEDWELIFPWPYSRTYIWRYLRRILRSAGLPATRRDMFHRIRRTSYTAVMAALGKEAASDHAGHRSDLSRYYADPTKLPQIFGCDVLPRP